MNKWQQVKLGDVSESCLGKMLDQRKNKGELQPYLANIDVRWGEFDLDHLGAMKFESHEQERYGLRYGDLVICEGGEPGRCAIWKDQISNMKIQKALHRVRTDLKVLDNRFLFYWFLLAGKTGELEQYFTGATIKHMPGQKLKEVKIPLPPIEVQRKIADILSAYDDLIENNRKQIKLLEEAAQRLYKEWFIDLRFPGHETTPIIDGIPKGWERKKLEKICPILTGKRDANFGSPEGKYLFFTCAQEPIKSATFSFDTSAVILAGNGDFNVKLYRGKFEAYQRTYVLSPQNSEMLFLLFGSVRTNMCDLTQKASGSTIKFLTKGMIANIEILVPDDNLLKQYNNFSNNIQKKIEYLSDSIKYVTETRNRLLPKLMSGELEVKNG